MRVDAIYRAPSRCTYPGERLGKNMGERLGLPLGTGDWDADWDADWDVDWDWGQGACDGGKSTARKSTAFQQSSSLVSHIMGQPIPRAGIGAEAHLSAEQKPRRRGEHPQKLSWWRVGMSLVTVIIAPC